MGKDNNHVRTARAVYCDHCDVVIVTSRLVAQSCAHCARCVLLTIVTSRLVATWCHRLECPPG